MARLRVQDVSEHLTRLEQTLSSELGEQRRVLAELTRKVGDLNGHTEALIRLAQVADELISVARAERERQQLREAEVVVREAHKRTPLGRLERFLTAAGRWLVPLLLGSFLGGLVWRISSRLF